MINFFALLLLYLKYYVYICVTKNITMKTKFTINGLIFSGNGGIDANYADYEKNYKPFKWQLNKRNEEVYMIIDHQIDLNEGDRVSLPGIWLTLVDWKCVNVIEGNIEYALVEE